MKTLLEQYCEFAGWQGGTIHQAIEDFKARTSKERDAFCNRILVNGTDKLSTPDLKQFGVFLTARLEASGVQIETVAR